MRDKDDSRGKLDWNNDGVTGYTQGANPRSNLITENMGKTILIIVAVIIVASVVVALSASQYRDKAGDVTPAQSESGQN